MRKIGTCDWRFGIADAVKKVIPTALDSGVDIYQEDDDSVRIFPHKDFIKADNMATDWLKRNHAYLGSPYTNIYYAMPFPCVIICACRSYEKIKIGMAKFNKNDEHFSYAVGKALAYSRASGKKLPADLAAYLGIKQ